MEIVVKLYLTNIYLFKLCSLEKMNLEESVNMNLFGWICLFFWVDLEDKVNGFENEFYES